MDAKEFTLQDIRSITERVSTVISDKDDMFSGSKKSYFYGGQTALNVANMSMVSAGQYKNWELNPKSFLTLPCGFGRELRYFTAAYPNAHHVVCDLVRPSVNFCVKTFGVEGIYSSVDIAEVRDRLLALNRKFSVIWAGSFFTHLSQYAYIKYLELFEELLEPGGVAVFSVQGLANFEKLKNGNRDYGLTKEKIDRILTSYGESGFGYANYDSTYFSPDWGVTFATTDWVREQLKRLPNSRVAGFNAKAYANIQDVWSFMKT